MKKIGLLLLAGFLMFGATLPLLAQTEDPSEVFLKAYMTSQQGEKLEQDNQFAAALAKFRFAGSLLEELKKRHPEWQPAIIDYRARKIGESITRVQSKIGTQTDLAATAQPPPTAAASPLLPRNPGRPSRCGDQRCTRPGERDCLCRAASPATAPPQRSHSRGDRRSNRSPVASAKVNEAAIKEATKNCNKVDQLQSERSSVENGAPKPSPPQFKPTHIRGRRAWGG
jgi:hypothetical protein